MARGRPSPGEEHLPVLPGGRAGLVLPDASAVEGLHAVDKHAGVTRGAADGADGTDYGDRAPGESNAEHLACELPGAGEEPSVLPVAGPCRHAARLERGR